MDKNLIKNALVKYISGVVLVAALIFISAGTLNFIRGWIFMALLFIPMLIGGLIMLRFAPELLRKRLTEREEGVQTLVIALSGVMFIAAFIVSGLDFRFGWSQLSNETVFIAGAVFLIGYGVFAETLRENEFISRTVEIQEGQRVIDTGLYGIVRHPMYSASVLMFLMMPLLLGSLIGFYIMLAYIPIIVVRIIGEEKLLSSELAGYEEYRAKVRWRLIPLIW
ncbi:MAG: isoprenylcysteine carboxylmethyltransferase family protein [Oscillospiraceae bacterium]|nr:isoprenylcysteine carboxylmethyltransferase family protein [Oscillospiraceae bacterium]